MRARVPQSYPPGIGQENRDDVFGGVDVALEWWNRRFEGRQLALGEGDVKIVCNAFLGAGLDKIQIAPCFVDALARRDKPGLERSQIKIGPHDIHDGLPFSGIIMAYPSAYSQLYFGLAGAIVLIYLVIVVNFQSWLDPFIIVTALPGALAGIVWMLFMTGTTLSAPALTGAIMCMGIATADSILLVSFAREGLAAGFDSASAALEVGFTRFRPVLMTALTMIIGMLPMAFALGEGGEQNAPPGRAVIGGLLVATLATLFFVPTVFSVLHRQRDRGPRDNPEAPQAEAA